MKGVYQFVPYGRCTYCGNRNCEHGNCVFCEGCDECSEISDLMHEELDYERYDEDRD